MRFCEIKTPSDLKYLCHEELADKYFSRSTMKFFGDTMRNYGVRRHWVDGDLFIELHRKRPVKHGLCTSRYFCLAADGSAELAHDLGVRYDRRPA